MEKKLNLRNAIGFSKMEKKYEWKDHVIFCGLLLGLAFWVNRGIEIRGLYMDDLYFWSCYGEQSFLEYVFPVGSTRFRFLYYLAAWLEMAFVGNHVEWFVPLNILLNTALAWMLYAMAGRLSRSKWVGFLCSALFLSSSMAYYQIGQVLGLMETMALAMAVLILWFLWRFLNEKGQGARYYGAVALYFGVCFVHERYMALIPLFFLVLVFTRSRKPAQWLAPVLTFGLVQAIRLATIGGLMPAGTGGTQVSDTFSLSQAISFAFSQVAYVFGINAGPEHLNGCPWADTPFRIKALVIGADLMAAVVVLGFLKKMIQELTNQEESKTARSMHRAAGLSMAMNSALFLTFIALCIGVSSVTIRVEMRWIYVSLAAALLFLAYMYGTLNREVRRELYLKRLWPWGAALILYVVLMIPVELFYRSCYPKLYLWPDQMRYNSLAEETWERYGEDIFGKTIYIIGDSYEMSDFTAETFFKVFDPQRRAEGTQVRHIESIRDFGLVTDQMLVLREDPDHNAFQDVTDFVRDMKLHLEYGAYEDGWMDENAAVQVMAGSTGVIDLEIMYPGVMSGGEAVTITREGEPPRRVPIQASVTQVQIQAQPWQLVKLNFQFNFYVQNAQEQRGEDRLAAIVNIQAD